MLNFNSHFSRRLVLYHAVFILLPSYSLTQQQVRQNWGIAQISKNKNTPTRIGFPYPNCAHDQISTAGPQVQTPRYPLLNKAKLAIYPLQGGASSISLRISLSDSVYKAVVNGSSVEFLRCSLFGTRCDVVDEWARKSMESLQPQRWNFVTANVTKSGIVISFDQNINLMSVTSVTEEDIKRAEWFIAVEGGTAQSYVTYLVQFDCRVLDKPVEPYYPECEVEELNNFGPVRDSKEFPLMDGSKWAIYPLFNDVPAITMRIMLANYIYTATIEGTMVVLHKCRKAKAGSEMPKCSVEEEKSAKDTDLILPHMWNFIHANVTHTGITINIGPKLSVMSMPSFTTQQTFANALWYVSANGSLNRSMQYLVQPDCSVVPLSVQTPYASCPEYHLDSTTGILFGSPVSPLTEGSKMVIYPYQYQPSTVTFNLDLYNWLYKITVAGSKCDLYECDEFGTNCKMQDSVNVEPLRHERWNVIMANLTLAGVTISFGNTAFELPASRVQAQYFTNYKWYASVRDNPPTQPSKFIVQYKCDVVVQVPTTPSGYSTPAPQIDVTTEATPEDNSKFGIIIGCLIAVALIILAAAITYSVIKKRRSQNITEATPIQQETNSSKGKK